MYVTIPVNTTEDASPVVVQVQLEGSSYQLYFRYNERSSFWRCDILDQQGTALAAGLPVRNYGLPFNLPLYLHDGMIQGLLYAFASNNIDTDAGPNELGGRVSVLYRSAVA